MRYKFSLIVNEREKIIPEITQALEKLQKEEWKFKKEEDQFTLRFESDKHSCLVVVDVSVDHLNSYNTRTPVIYTVLCEADLDL